MLLPQRGRGLDGITGWIVGALLSKAAGKPHTTVARGGKRLELSKGCLCMRVCV